MATRASNTDWSGEWSPSTAFTGAGVVVTGTVVSHRPHSGILDVDVCY